MASSSNQTASIIAPWFRRGGMCINLVGIGLNLVCVVIFMIQSTSSYSTDYWKPGFLALLVLHYFISAAIFRMKTLYCIFVVPTYVTSLLISFSMDHQLFLLFVSVAVSIIKVAICMSVALHRYAAHSAFKCGPATHVVLSILGCLASQGGPVWWASQHHCHHKLCDTPGDPHSCSIVGTERAFAFFEDHLGINFEFCPPHVSLFMMLLDTWAFLGCSIEFTLVHTTSSPNTVAAVFTFAFQLLL